MKDGIVQDFLHARQGFPPDRVVADPEWNRVFLDECDRLGLGPDASKLNKSLLNARKSSYLRGIRSRRTQLKERSEYRFAAEMAARFLERRYEVSLDHVICDPVLVAQFDEIARTIAPGGTLLDYRWAAFSLRKQKRLSPEILARVARPIEVLRLEVDRNLLDSVPTSPGLYIFYSSHQTLYIGVTDNLQKRIGKHIDHSDNKGLARWLWEYDDARLHLELQVLERSITQRIRRALELELIRSRRPVFNVKR
jgi:predicted GIY-YIG superfamily endonuclease